MSALFLTTDLMIASQVDGAAERCGVPLEVTASAEALARKCPAGDVKMVMIDLGVAGLEIEALVLSLKKTAAMRPTIIAFGPHVHANRLESARAAGCDEVLSRGGFYAQIEELLRRYG